METLSGGDIRLVNQQSAPLKARAHRANAVAGNVLRARRGGLKLDELSRMNCKGDGLLKTSTAAVNE